MDSIKFYNGTSVSAEDLNNAQTCLQEGIKHAVLDTRTYGVLVDQSSKDIVFNYEGNQTINIDPFVAYDIYGNRIEVSTRLTGLLPKPDGEDVGKLIAGGDAIPVGEYKIVARYVETLSDAVEKIHVIKKVPYKTHVKGGYELYLRGYAGTTEKAGDVLLATVIFENTDTGVILTSIDTTKQNSSTINANVVVGSVVVDASTNTTIDQSFSEHINSVGSGEITTNNPHGLSASDLGIDIAAMGKHQLLCHDTGVRSDNINTTTSALYPAMVLKTAAITDEITIQPLSSLLNEMLVVNGKSVMPNQISNTYRFSFSNLNRESYIGYYIFSFNVETMAIQVNGPYASETASGFKNILNNKSFYPICSVQWANQIYDVSDTNISSYNLMAHTFKDRRVFNTLGLKNIHTDEIFALTQFAPICTDTAYIHNARLIGTKNDSYYSVAGNTLTINIDGVDTHIKFTGANPMSVSNVIQQMREALTVNNKLKAFVRLTNDGYISISAPDTLLIDTTTTAASILGFSIDSHNVSSTHSENEVSLIKEMIYYGDRFGLILFEYDDDDDVTTIDYYLGGKHRKNIFNYNANKIITSVEEIVEDL